MLESYLTNSTRFGEYHVATAKDKWYIQTPRERETTTIRSQGAEYFIRLGGCPIVLINTDGLENRAEDRDITQKFSICQLITLFLSSEAVWLYWDKSTTIKGITKHMAVLCQLHREFLGNSWGERLQANAEIFIIVHNSFLFHLKLSMRLHYLTSIKPQGCQSITIS